MKPYPAVKKGSWFEKIANDARYLAVVLKDDPEGINGKSKVFDGEFETEDELLETLRLIEDSPRECEVIIWRTVAMDPDEVAEILGKM